MRGPGYEEHPEHEVKMRYLQQQRVQVVLDGEIIADSTQAIRLEETGHEPVIYIPKTDLQHVQLVATKNTYECPFKGHAEFYSLKHQQKIIDDALWEYDDPFDDIPELKGLIAFYPDKVDAINILPQ